MPKKKPIAAKNASQASAKTRPKTKMTPAEGATGTVVFQVKITLNDVRPRIWRRVQTKDCTLAKMHNIIQASMGWLDRHLHVFRIGNDRYGDPEQWPKDDYRFELETLDERSLTLTQIVDKDVKKFAYEYDMGDDWHHAVLIEKTVPGEHGVKYPRCIAGERACPPEDCGGPLGYPYFLDAIQDPKHESHYEQLEWVGGEFDPEAFDLDFVNTALQEVG